MVSQIRSPTTKKPRMNGTTPRSPSAITRATSAAMPGPGVDRGEIDGHVDEERGERHARLAARAPIAACASRQNCLVASPASSAFASAPASPDHSDEKSPLALFFGGGA